MPIALLLVVRAVSLLTCTIDVVCRSVFADVEVLGVHLLKWAGHAVVTNAQQGSI